MFRFSIVSPHSPSFKSVSDLTIPNKIEYAKRWGFDLHLPDYPDEKANKDKGWGRIDFMQQYLHKTDWMLYLGADTIFMNFRIDARAWCIDHYEWLLAFDQNGIQTDVMFMKNTQNVHAVLDQARNRRKLDFSAPGLAGSDQGALVTVLSGREKYVNGMEAILLKNKVKLTQASKVINRYIEDYLPGDFIYHAAGGDHFIEPPASKKARQIRQFLPLVIK